MAARGKESSRETKNDLATDSGSREKKGESRSQRQKPGRRMLRPYASITGMTSDDDHDDLKVVEF